MGAAASVGAEGAGAASQGASSIAGSADVGQGIHAARGAAKSAFSAIDGSAAIGQGLHGASRAASTVAGAAGHVVNADSLNAARDLAKQLPNLADVDVPISGESIFDFGKQYEYIFLNVHLLFLVF